MPTKVKPQRIDANNSPLVGQVLKYVSDDEFTWENEAASAIDFSLFGNGSDGDVTITTTVTLSSDMQYNNLTINSPGVLNPNGYKVYVKGTLSGNGTIRRNGNNGAIGLYGANIGPSTGGAGGAALNNGTLFGCVAGANGGSGGSQPGVAPQDGGNGQSTVVGYTNTNGANGGDGGTSFTPGSGGTGGTSVKGLFIEGKPDSILEYEINFTTILNAYKLGGGAAGGGGGTCNNSSFLGGGGGGGGSSGGIIFLSANIFNFSGTIESIGGNGGDGATTNGAANSTGGGGGGGGNGGLIILSSTSYISIGTQSLSGGSGGSGGGGFATGVNGDNGNSGTLIQITV